MIRRTLLLTALAALPAHALVPDAARALDCAALTIVLGADPDAARAAMARALAAEMAQTGAFSERALPAVQAELAARVTAAARLDAATAEARRRAACPSGA